MTSHHFNNEQEVNPQKMKNTISFRFKTIKNHQLNQQRTMTRKRIEFIKSSAVATLPNKGTKELTAKATGDQTNKVAKQGQYKNQDPIVLVHGFNGFTDDINPSVLAHYWGGNKMNIRQDLEENGYKAYEASISAFGSNYDRAVELYYYIKGGRVIMVQHMQQNMDMNATEKHTKEFTKTGNQDRRYTLLDTAWVVKRFVN